MGVVVMVDVDMVVVMADVDMVAKKEKLTLNLKPMPQRSLKLMLNLTQKLKPIMDTEDMVDMEDMAATVDMAEATEDMEDMAEKRDQLRLIEDMVDMEAMEGTVVVMAVGVMEDTVTAVN